MNNSFNKHIILKSKYLIPSIFVKSIEYKQKLIINLAIIYINFNNTQKKFQKNEFIKISVI